MLTLMYKNPLMTPFGLLAVAPTRYWPFLDAELKYTASMALKRRMSVEVFIFYYAILSTTFASDDNCWAQSIDSGVALDFTP